MYLYFHQPKMGIEPSKQRDLTKQQHIQTVVMTSRHNQTVRSCYWDLAITKRLCFMNFHGLNPEIIWLVVYLPL
jgi:hypothetical protein